jgi:hypothetical protein
MPLPTEPAGSHPLPETFRVGFAAFGKTVATQPINPMPRAVARRFFVFHGM